MINYKLKVLFKNGIEKEFDMASGDEALLKISNSIKQSYSDNLNGVLEIGTIYIRLSDTICIMMVDFREYKNEIIIT